MDVAIPQPPHLENSDYHTDYYDDGHNMRRTTTEVHTFHHPDPVIVRVPVTDYHTVAVPYTYYEQNQEVVQHHELVTHNHLVTTVTPVQGYMNTTVPVTHY